jgi:hypothetical protein
MRREPSATYEIEIFVRPGSIALLGVIFIFQLELPALAQHLVIPAYHASPRIDPENRIDLFLEESFSVNPVDSVAAALSAIKSSLHACHLNEISRCYPRCACSVHFFLPKNHIALFKPTGQCSSVGMPHNNNFVHCCRNGNPSLISC